jgi:hypothetical protein
MNTTKYKENGLGLPKNENGSMPVIGIENSMNLADIE